MRGKPHGRAIRAPVLKALYIPIMNLLFWLKDIRCPKCGHRIRSFRRLHIANHISKQDDWLIQHRWRVCPSCRTSLKFSNSIVACIIWVLSFVCSYWLFNYFSEKYAFNNLVLGSFIVVFITLPICALGIMQLRVVKDV